ncbi:MAG: hypothetical protein ACOC5R_03035, partial [Elusimicrobiota bacterium]
MKKIVLVITGVLTFILSYVCNIIAIEFKDVTPEINKAAKECSNSGLFGPFIYKYGQDLFRPQGSVKRADLMLILNEYRLMTHQLLRKNREISEQIDKISVQPQTVNKELIQQEVKDNLNTLLRKSNIIKDLSLKVSNLNKIDNNVVNLETKLNKLSKKFNEVDFENLPSQKARVNT